MRGLPTFVVQQEVVMAVGGVAAGSDVYVDGVGRGRAEMSTTTVSAAHRQRRLLGVSLRHRRVPDTAGTPRVGGVGLGRGEVDEGEVDALTTTDDDPPRARRRRQTDVGRRRPRRPVVGQEAVEAAHERRSVRRAARLHRSRHCHTAVSARSHRGHARMRRAARARRNRTHRTQRRDSRRGARRHVQ